MLKFLALWYPLESISLKQLTLKWIALVALATAPRAQTLKALDLDFRKIHSNSAVFYFPHLLKTSQVGKNNSFVLKLEHFPEETLCVFHTLLYYLKVTFET